MPFYLNKKIYKTILSTTASLLISALPSSGNSAGNPDYYSPQNLLIGATPTLQAGAKNGAGVTVGVVDTGGTASWVGFQGYGGNTSQGRIISSTCLVSCTGLSTGNIDDNGHGTFVTSEIIGGFGYNGSNYGMLGIAPAANAIEVKVLDANGSGYSNTAANGIISATNSGAQIINLSLGPSGTPAQQAAFYNSLANAINYAASKNVIVVFAGGNSAQAFSGGTNITGFTDAAIQHMLFVGSTNASKTISSFSNTPGSSGFTSTTGKFYAYKNMWLMVDGENIYGASNYSTKTYGYSYITQMSGTSMAAPQAVGSLALLEAQWPILRTNNTASQVLLQTASDLGATGVDTTYGSGFINLTSAFQPVGNLSVVTSSGKSVLVSNLTGSMITGGALGSLSNISSALSNYTAFDTFQRNFATNLSGLITVKPSSTASSTVTAAQTTTKSVKFADGSNLTFGSVEQDSHSLSYPGGSDNNSAWFLEFNSFSGTSMTMGNGLPASSSFASAMWGSDNFVAAGAVNSLGASNSLVNLSQGGTFVSFGDQLDKGTRMAFSLSSTRNINNDNPFVTSSDAMSISSGITNKITDKWTAGLTLGLLDENNSMLGSSYTQSGPLSLGENHQSVSVGFSSDVKFGGNLDLVIDAAIVRTDGAQMADSIISNVSSLYSRSFGASLVQQNAISKGDSLSFSVKAPLAVFSGSGSIVTTSVDSFGNPVVGGQNISLVPTGTEFDFGLGYSAISESNINWNISLDSRRNVDNINGLNSQDILFGTKFSF